MREITNKFAIHARWIDEHPHPGGADMPDDDPFLCDLEIIVGGLFATANIDRTGGGYNPRALLSALPLANWLCDFLAHSP